MVDPGPVSRAIAVLVDFRQGKKEGDDQGAEDNAEDAEHAHGADDGEKDQQGVDMEMAPHQFGLEAVVDGEGDGQVQDQHQQTLPCLAHGHQNQGGGDQDQADAENGQEGGEAHYPAPDHGGLELQQDKEQAAQGALNQAAGPVADKDCPADLVEFAHEQGALFLRQR